VETQIHNGPGTSLEEYNGTALSYDIILELIQYSHSTHTATLWEPKFTMDRVQVTGNR